MGEECGKCASAFNARKGVVGRDNSTTLAFNRVLVFKGAGETFGDARGTVSEDWGCLRASNDIGTGSLFLGLILTSIAVGTEVVLLWGGGG